MFFPSVTYWDLESQRLELIYSSIVGTASKFGSLLLVNFFNVKCLFPLVYFQVFSKHIRRPVTSYFLMDIARLSLNFVGKGGCKIPQQKFSSPFLLSLKLLQPQTILSVGVPAEGPAWWFIDACSLWQQLSGEWWWPCLIMLFLETSVDYNSSYSSLFPISFNITLVPWQAAFSTTSGGQLPAHSLLSTSEAGLWRKMGSPGGWAWVADPFCGFCLAVLNLWRNV